MSFQISRWAIERPTPTILLFLLLSVAGIYSYLTLPLGGTPKVELPIVQVDIALPGATPTELESSVARKVEAALAGLPSLKHQRTSIRTGQLSITAEFALDHSVDRATQDVRDAVLRVRPELPGAISEPIVTRVDLAGNVQLRYAVESDRLSTPDLTRLVDEEVIPALLAVKGIQQVAREGGARREYRVEIVPERLIAHRLALTDVLRQIESSELNAPGGSVIDGGTSAAIRVVGASASIDELRNVSLVNRDGQRLRLADVATVLDGSTPMQSFALLDGVPVIVLEISKARGADETAMADGAKAALEAFAEKQSGVRFRLFQDAVEYTRENYRGARSMLLEGAFLTILVVYGFLRDWRATSVAALAIPFSLFPTFVIMKAFGFSLNIITLLALILIIGILVDDAIVEVENIERRIERGEPPRLAALNGADTIGLAVVAITLTIVAVFLPVSFISGVVGQFFGEFGLTASAAVLSSLLVARTLTPILCAWMLRPKPSHRVSEPGWVPRYVAFLSWALAHRGVMVAAAGVLLAGTAAILTAVPTGFLPPTQANEISVKLSAHPGTPLHGMVSLAERYRHALRNVPDIQAVFSYSGDESGQAELLIVLVPRSSRVLEREELVLSIRGALAQVPDARAELLLGDGVKQVVLPFRGDDPAALEAWAKRLFQEARSVQGLDDVGHTIPVPLPTFSARVDEAVADRLNVNVGTISDVLARATVGGLDALLPRVPVNGELIPIRARLMGGSDVSLDLLLNTPLFSDRGDPVPISSVVRLDREDGPASIARLDQKRIVEINANLTGITLGEALVAIQSLPVYAEMPDSVEFANYGETQYMSEMFVQFGVAILLGLLAVYAILVLLFHDWVQPVTIMMAIPLSVGGAALALLMTGNSINLSTVIGFLMLFGIVGKNSILLVDFIVEARDQGQARLDAVLGAGRERARPIVMTTIAMVGGMVPAAIGFGGDDGFRAPMAIAVIGGLIASTLLSLLLIPVAYTLVDDLESRVSLAFHRSGGAS